MASDLVPKGYEELLRDLKERIRTAQVRAALAVNRELVLPEGVTDSTKTLIE